MATHAQGTASSTYSSYAVHAHLLRSVDNLTTAPNQSLPSTTLFSAPANQGLFVLGSDCDSMQILTRQGFTIEPHAAGRERWTLTPIYWGESRKPPTE